MQTADLNDPLDDLFNASPTAARPTPPADYRAPSFDEPCSKCRGTGRFVGYTGRVLGACHKCKGTGRLAFASSRDDRAKARVQRADRVARKGDEAVEAFKAECPAEFAWIEQAAPGFEFAASMLEAIRKYGSLTDNQLGAVRRCMARRASAEEARQQRIENAPVVDAAGVDRLKEAFDTAISNAAAKGTGRGIRRLRLTFGDVVISPAKATSANPGALYVKRAGEYMGKIADGKFFGSRECDPATSKLVVEVLADPKQAAQAYGQETGTCCICNATLISKWKERGIGPVCAEKFGW